MRAGGPGFALHGQMKRMESMNAVAAASVWNVTWNRLYCYIITKLTILRRVQRRVRWYALEPGLEVQFSETDTVDRQQRSGRQL